VYISYRFGIASDINLWSNLWENQLIDAQLIDNHNFSTRMCHFDPMLLRSLLLLKFEDSAGFSLALYFRALFDIEIKELLFASICVKGVDVKLLFWTLIAYTWKILFLAEGKSFSINFFHLLFLLPISKFKYISYNVVIRIGAIFTIGNK